MPSGPRGPTAFRAKSAGEKHTHFRPLWKTTKTRLADLSAASIFLVIYHGLIKDTKTKCRLFWCLIEFIGWRYSQLRWCFDQVL